VSNGVPGAYVPIPSPPASPQARAGDAGTPHGWQQSRTIPAGDAREQPCIDEVNAEFLWRFSVFGRVLVRVVYGTSSTREYVDLQAPVVMTVPGKLCVSVRAADPEEDTPFTVTCTPATGGARSQARRLVDSAVDFSDDAVSFVALVASTLTVGGQAVTLATGQSVPLIAPSSLVSGAGFEEFEA
jgi:hypothetical protein